ncbi:hypothetical protein JOF35_005969 [Streptomyces demainii]|uniref:Transposase DDE domain-containing protein n=1 Tax=Streptomyces demainii TaxID=588122 RepID=A0ABT9KYU9_9ACTN|nr:hypothetical protein [Streptomyces demainii]
MSHNLLRAAGALTPVFHAKATTTAIRTHLVHIPARLARSARRLTLRPLRRWPWHAGWMQLFDTVHRLPEPA